MEFTIPSNGSPIRATMSFGITCRESLSQTTDEIIHNADAALYHSKLTGRNRVYAYTRDGYVTYKSGSLQKAVQGSSHHPADLMPEGSFKSQ